MMPPRKMANSDVRALLYELLNLEVLPHGWAECSTGDFARVVGGGTPPTKEQGNFTDGGFPWITPADLGSHKGMYIRAGRRSLSNDGICTSSATPLPKG